ncbi:MAG: hypothetical protein J6X49_10865 [Victivallales bacterium]|nr:hypothetical protein [Victivallales bacterium]
MTDYKDLVAVYRQNLEEDIIMRLAELKSIDLRKAMDIYYKSRLARQIRAGLYGIDNMDARYLAVDLVENEPELFEPQKPTPVSDKKP